MSDLRKYDIDTLNERPALQTIWDLRVSRKPEQQLGSLSSVPAGRWQRVLAAASAAPGRVSACAGGAASLGSPARTQAPARPAGRRQTPAAPLPRPRPGERTAGQKIKRLNDLRGLAAIWTHGPTSASGGSSAMN